MYAHVCWTCRWKQKIRLMDSDDSDVEDVRSEVQNWTNQLKLAKEKVKEIENRGIPMMVDVDDDDLDS